MKHKKKNEIKLGKNEEFTEDVYPNNGKCPDLEQASVVHFVQIVTITTMIMICRKNRISLKYWRK